MPYHIIGLVIAIRVDKFYQILLESINSELFKFRGTERGIWIFDMI